MRVLVPTALASAATMALVIGCAHTLGPQMEPARVAKDVGFPNCRVSVPLSPEEMLATARLVGVSAPETQSDWVQMQTSRRPGDQLRFVSCSSGKHAGAAGHSFFGLFRGGSVALEAFQMIDN